MRKGTALTIVIASAACFATLAVLATLAYDRGARPLPLLTWRFALAAVALGSYAAVRRPGALRVGPGELARYAALSLTGYGAASVCFFFALEHASASVVAVLLYAYPALVAALHAFGSRTLPGARVVAGVLVTFLGCVGVAGVLEQQARVDATGVLLGLGAAVAYAAFTILSDRLAGGRSRLVVMTYMFGTSAVAMGIVALLAGESLSVAAWQPRLWLIMGLIVAVPTVLAVVLYLEGIRRLGPSRAALASTIEPVFTIGLAAWLLGERLTLLQLAGAAFVVAGIALSHRADDDRGVAPSSA